ncbi:MAG: hypothetical protein GEU78_18035, partial [Actinobacteria bacterium]|nr:hypothetical protein [Actinomycetota bacterium]
MPPSLRPGPVVFGSMARSAKGLAEVTEGINQAFRIGEQPFGVIPGRLGELNRSRWLFNSRWLGFRSVS